MAAEGNSEGGWPGGWLIAVAAGVVAAILARWLGDVTMAAAVLVGIFVFLVFGVLLGMFWAAPATGDHGASDHGHDAHGHTDHGHEAAPVAAPVVARVSTPVAAVEPVAPVVAAAAVPVAAPVTAAIAPIPVVAVEPAAALEPVPTSGMAIPVAALGRAVRPAALAGPRGGVSDKLKTIEGIGPAMEKLCHDLGIFHFDQIASWGAGEVAWMDSNLKGFKGRVTRDKWVDQARLIGEVGIDEFLRRAKSNGY